MTINREPRDEVADIIFDLIAEDGVTIEMISADLRRYFPAKDFPSVDELKEAINWAWRQPKTYWVPKYEGEE